MDIYNKLRELNDNDLEDFNLNNKSCIGKVTKVFNGKNLKIILLLDGIILKFNCYYLIYYSITCFTSPQVSIASPKYGLITFSSLLNQYAPLLLSAIGQNST